MSLSRLLALSIAILWSFGIVNAADVILYPFDQISKSSCKFERWESLSDDCKQSQPRIDNVNYSAYSTSTEVRRNYSVLWTASYEWGWDMGQGGHLWVDIATSAGTPVRTIMAGKVIVAGWKAGWGNTVSVRHVLESGRVIFSNYTHMESVSVAVGQTLKVGEIVGKVGSTGNSTGNHLHFQIDITDVGHPYYYTACGEGESVFKVVDSSRCTQYLYQNTVDPLDFLERGERAITDRKIPVFTTPIIATNTSSVGVSTNPQKNQGIIINEAPKTPTKPSAPVINNPIVVDNTPVIRDAVITGNKTRAQILAEEINDFLRLYTINLEVPTTLWVGGSVSGQASITANGGRAFVGNLPTTLLLESSNDNISVVPSAINISEIKPRDIKIIGKLPGRTTITVKFGSKILKKYSVQIFDPKSVETPIGAKIDVEKKQTLGGETTGTITLLGKGGALPQGVKYSGSYELRVIEGNAMICNASSDVNCRDKWMTKTLGFDYSTTKDGKLVFKFLPQSYTPVKLAVFQTVSKSRIGLTISPIRIDKPIDYPTGSLYASALDSAIGAGLLSSQAGYIGPARAITWGEAKAMISRSLTARGKSTAQLSSIFPESKNGQPLKRAEAASVWMRALSINTFKTRGTAYLDEKGEYASTIATLRLSGFQWKDQFAEKYFQPESLLTRAEAAYLFNYLVTLTK